MYEWFDPLTDIFFRPFIRKPKKGASTAIGLLLDQKRSQVTGQLYVNNHRKSLSDKYEPCTERAVVGNNGAFASAMVE